MPSILGHEGAGTVVEVGPGVTSVRAGDNVIPLWRLSCGECEYCTSARPALCALGMKIRSTGRLLDGSSRFSLDGSEIKHFLGVSTFSEYTVILEKALVKVPDDIPLQQAALLGCAVITGIGAVMNAAQVKPGSRVAIFGCGGVGLNVVQGAALAGAEKIIAVDLLDNKLDMARQFGATHTVNASSGDPVEQVRSLTQHEGVDYAFEVVGLPKSDKPLTAWPSAAWLLFSGSHLSRPRYRSRSCPLSLKSEFLRDPFMAPADPESTFPS